MKYTQNLRLRKPEGTELVNVGDFNTNADIVDDKVTQQEAEISTRVQGAETKIENGEPLISDERGAPNVIIGTDGSVLMPETEAEKAQCNAYAKIVYDTSGNEAVFVIV